MQNELDNLKLIEKVEAPPFLYTRIMQRIETETAKPQMKNFTWAIGISMVIILAFNIIAISSRGRQSEKNNSLIMELSLVPQNNLYNE